MDDGRGYPPHLIGRIGEPFVRRRSAAADPRRPGYEGMGLGLFIAKTLLERSGADLSFANGAESFRNDDGYADRRGAVVEVTWPRRLLELSADGGRPPLGENQPILN